MELHHLGLRTLLGYLVLLGLLRASGKRTIEQGTPFDFVLALVLGDMVDDLLWAEVSAARFTVAVGTMTLVHTLASLADNWSPRFARLIAGEPAVVMEGGQPRPDALRAERISARELQRMLRHEGVAAEDGPDVRRVTVEVSGQAVVRREPWAEAPQKRDLPHMGPRPA